MVDGEEEAELQGTTASILLLGLGSCVDGIGLDAMRDREETGGAMACCSELAGRFRLGLSPNCGCKARRLDQVVITTAEFVARGGRVGSECLTRPRHCWRAEDVENLELTGRKSDTNGIEPAIDLGLLACDTYGLTSSRL